MVGHTNTGRFFWPLCGRLGSLAARGIKRRYRPPPVFVSPTTFYLIAHGLNLLAERCHAWSKTRFKKGRVIGIHKWFNQKICWTVFSNEIFHSIVTHSKNRQAFCPFVIILAKRVVKHLRNVTALRPMFRLKRSEAFSFARQSARSWMEGKSSASYINIENFSRLFLHRQRQVDFQSVWLQPLLRSGPQRSHDCVIFSIGCFV